MGSYVDFSLINERKSLEDLVLEHYQGTREYCLYEAIEDAECFGASFLTFLNQHKQLDSIADVPRAIIDELVFMFREYEYFNDALNCFEDLSGAGTWRKTQYYVSATQEVWQYANDEIKQLWGYLIKGRSLLNDATFGVEGLDTFIGFWTVKEQEIMIQFIEQHFDSLDNLSQISGDGENEKEALIAVARALNVARVYQNVLLFSTERTTEFDGLLKNLFASN